MPLQEWPVYSSVRKTNGAPRLENANPVAIFVHYNLCEEAFHDPAYYVALSD